MACWRGRIEGIEGARLVLREQRVCSCLWCDGWCGCCCRNAKPDHAKPDHHHARASALYFLQATFAGGCFPELPFSFFLKMQRNEKGLLFLWQYLAWNTRRG